MATPWQRVLAQQLMKNTALVEAPLGSAWSAALDKADCMQLMHLLEENPCWVVQTGKRGFTVLHAAAMRGCLKLLDQVHDLFQAENIPICTDALRSDFKKKVDSLNVSVKGEPRFVDKKEGIELSWQKFLTAEGICGIEEGINAVALTAAEFAWWSMGDCHAREYLNDGRRRFGSRTFSSYQSEIFGSSMDSEGADEENPSPRPLLLGVLKDLPQETYAKPTPFSCVSHDLKIMHALFEEDLAYNFVVDFEELRFHHACQYLDIGIEVFKKYVEKVIGGCVEKGPHMLRYLFQLRNAQGQTPLHVAPNVGTCLHLVGLIPGRESGDNAECLNMRDSRGWTALHRCASFEGLSHELRVLLEDGRADVNAKVLGRREECTRATPLHLAVMYNNSKAVEMLLQNPRTDVNAHFHRHLYFDDNLHVSRLGHPLKEWTVLQLAAVAGLPEMVKVLLKFARVCICFHDKATNSTHSISL